MNLPRRTRLGKKPQGSADFALRIRDTEQGAIRIGSELRESAQPRLQRAGRNNYAASVTTLLALRGSVAGWRCYDDDAT
jgi:hypothetical protein